MFSCSPVSSRCEKTTEVLVDAVDHGAVNGHDPCLVGLLFGTQFIPRLVHRFRARMRLGVDDAELQLALVARLRNGLVADVVFALVLCDVFRPCLDRIMRGRVGEVQEERLLVVLLFVATQQVDGPVRERIGRVVVHRIRRERLDAFRIEAERPLVLPLVRGERLACALVTRVEVVRRTVAHAPVVVETHVVGIIYRVVLADHQRLVANRLQHITQCRVILVSAFCRDAQPNPLRILSGQQSGRALASISTCCETG